MPILLSRRAMLGPPLLGVPLALGLAPFLPRPGLAQGLAPGLAPSRAAALEALRQGASAVPKLHTLIVAQEGRSLLEEGFRGPGPDRPVNVKSVSKSVLSLLVGAALARGVLRGLDQPAAPVLGGLVPAEADPRVRDITLEHLLSMRAGLERTSGENYGAFASSRNWVRHILSRPFEEEPGGAMRYSTGDTHLLSAVLTRASGRSTLDLARDWLGGPLDIVIPPWPRDPQGIYFGGNDMLLSPRALLRIGEILRLDGQWQGRRVLPAEWIADSWTPRTRSPWSGQLYGLGWWIGQAGPSRNLFAWGYGGQFLFVLPELAATVVMTSEYSGPRDRAHTGALHALLAEAVLPALGAAPVPAAPPAAESGTL